MDVNDEKYQSEEEKDDGSSATEKLEKIIKEKKAESAAFKKILKSLEEKKNKSKNN